MTKQLADLIEKSDEVRHFLGEFSHEDSERLRDLLIDVAEIQSGILGLLAKDEETYESLRPAEERR